jgi:hypothetical protein
MQFRSLHKISPPGPVLTTKITKNEFLLPGAVRKVAPSAAMRSVSPCSRFPPSSAPNGHPQPDPACRSEGMTSHCFAEPSRGRSICEGRGWREVVWGAALRPVGPCSHFPPSSATNGHAQPDPHWPSGAITDGARPRLTATGEGWRGGAQAERGRGYLSQAARPPARTAMKNV